MTFPLESPDMRLLSQIEDDRENCFPYQILHEPRSRCTEKVAQRWESFFRQQESSPNEKDLIFPVTTYIEQLKELLSRHSSALARSPTLHSHFPPTTTIKSGFSPSIFLKKLEESMAASTFRVDFIQQNGISMLCEALKQIQAEIGIWERVEEETDIDILRSKMVDEFHCIMCIKFAARDLEDCNEIVSSSNNLEVICQSLLSPCMQSRIVAVDLLANLLHMNPGSLRPILQQFTSLRVKYAHRDRFQFLIGAPQAEDKLSLLFKASLLGMMNEMLMACPSGNYQVYLQTELEESGLNIAEVEKVANNLARIDESFEDANNVVRQVALWRENYILVDKPRRKHETANYTVIPHHHHQTRLPLPTYQYGCGSAVSTNFQSPAGPIPAPPVPVLPKKSQSGEIKVIIKSVTPSNKSAQSTISTAAEIHPPPSPSKDPDVFPHKRSLMNVFPDLQMSGGSSKTASQNLDRINRTAKFGAPTLQIQNDNLNHRMASKFSTEFHDWKRIRSGDSLDSGESSDSTESAGDYRGAVYLVDGISPAQRTLIDDVLLQFDRACDVLDAPTPEESRKFIHMV